jgi:hypothetical protein
MSEGFDDSEMASIITVFLQKKRKIKRCIALTRRSRKCRNRAKEDSDYCEAHIEEFRHLENTDENDHIDNMIEEDLGVKGRRKVMFQNEVSDEDVNIFDYVDQMEERRVCVVPKPFMGFTKSNSYKDSNIRKSRSHTIIPGKGAGAGIDGEAYLILKSSDSDSESDNENNREMKIQMEFQQIYGAGAGSIAQAEVDFENGSLPFKFFSILKNCSNKFNNKDKDPYKIHFDRIRKFREEIKPDFSDK